MLNTFPDHFRPSVRQAVAPSEGVASPKASRARVSHIIARSILSLRVTTARMTEAIYEALPGPADWQGLISAARCAGQLAARTVASLSDAVVGAGRLLVRTAASIRAWIALRDHKVEDPLVALVQAAKYRTVFNRISASANLSETERQVVEAISSSVRKTYQAGSEIVVEGEVVPRPMIIASGWACRRRARGNGRAQVLGFLAPGDAIGLRGNADTSAPNTIIALTTVETVDATQLIRLVQQSTDYIGIADALLQAVAEDEEFLTNQIFRLGSSSPLERMAHLLLEMHARLSAAGLATDRDFFMPITYETLAEALALTPKTAKQAMRRLKRMRLATFRYGRVKLMAPAELRRMSEFTPPGAWTDRGAAV